MRLKNEDFMIRVLSFIKRGLEKGYTLKKIESEVKRQIDTMFEFDTREKVRLRRYFMDYARCCTAHGTELQEEFLVKKVQKQITKVADREDTRHKLNSLDEQLKLGRVGYRRTVHGWDMQLGTPVIFYLCSTHISPAVDHKEYQGKVYVDRYWRKALETARCTDSTVKKVEQFIKDNNILTVQEVVTGEPFLIWRNHCKHFFTGIPTSEVLKSSAKEIRKNHREAITYERPKSKKRYRLDRERLRRRLKDLNQGQAR